MVVATRFREISAGGSPREIGRSIGEAARDEIRGFHAFTLDSVERAGGGPLSHVMAVADAALAASRAYGPDMVDELVGLAEGSGLTIDQIMVLQVRNQVHPDGACTSVSMPADAAAGQPALVAQNWDNAGPLGAFTVVTERRPTGKPAMATLGPAGLIGYIGYNEAGIGLCLNTLPAPRRTAGVPHYFTVRGILESTSLDAAVAAVRRADRAIPANIMLTAPEGPADLEVSIDGVHVLRPTEPDEGLTHTNHAEHPELEPVAREFGDLAQSRARKRRARELLAGPGITPAEVRSALSDHAGAPGSICRHHTDDTGSDGWETVFSVVIEPGQRRMDVARGTPCSHPYETYRLA